MKIIKVKSCKECPYIRLECLPGEHICFKMINYTRLEIDDIRNGIIPKWCPLEDYNGV